MRLGQQEIQVPKSVANANGLVDTLPLQMDDLGLPHPCDGSRSHLGRGLDLTHLT